ncbi:hypothetical protein FKW77_002657 [Venturia effusa]|uniref:SPIN90/Ldb17 leucine-rich domain-containing protein n=1 Tax=Venturia effusa TaxID=50376 RepID=A0A517L6W5_9PEZI|nr:hypothetical protein FKW77_002657 [Venturia effusa]
MDFEVSYNLDSAEQFWLELEDILSAQCQSHESIDNALRSYLAFTTNFKGEYLQSDDDIAKCSCKLLESAIFTGHQDYVRRQIVYALLQEDDAASLHLIAAILLHDGRASEETLYMMQTEGVFPRLVELIKVWDSRDEQLHRLLLHCMYEMSRIQRLTWEDMSAVDDSFVLSLFAITESLSSDASDPYHYPVIRVLLVLNEQYMVQAALASAVRKDSGGRLVPPLTNRVIKALSTHLSSWKTFGENLILLLNRESETSLQLLILKLLYLMFSNNSTAEYFYTNDLHVLTDVILRNLLDLPSEDDNMKALRNTYLRVLHMLLANSQFRLEGQAYKASEIRQVLLVLSGEGGHHFAPADPTTVRLVNRCREVEWLQEQLESPDNDLSPTITLSPVDGNISNGNHRRIDSKRETDGEGSKEVARRTLGMHLHDGGSALSVAAVAEHTEKPGVITPSRAHYGEENDT